MNAYTAVVADQFCQTPRGISLCYRSYGSPKDAPLMLVAGLGLQLICWPESLINALVQRGFWVIALDNRDSGRSTHLSAPPPNKIRMVLRQHSAEAYDLYDMAGDILALMNYLNIEKTHVLGVSMGGMIAQCLASHWPERVASLVSLCSSTGSLWVGQPAVTSLRYVINRPAATQEESVTYFIHVMSQIGPTHYALPEQELRNYAEQAWERDTGTSANEGFLRQVEAIIKTGDRTQHLRAIEAPTLVIHGDRDVMVHPSGGIATARAIRGAELVIIAGLGHAIPSEFSEHLANLMCIHALKSAVHPTYQPSTHPLKVAV